MCEVKKASENNQSYENVKIKIQIEIKKQIK